MAIRHTFRKNGAGALTTASITPIKAIRANCIECMGFQVKEVKECTSSLCPLHPFRLGKTHSGRKGSKNFQKKTVQKPVLTSQVNDQQEGQVKA